MMQALSRYRYAQIFKFSNSAKTNSGMFWLTITMVMMLGSISAQPIVAQVSERSSWLMRDVAKVTLDSSGDSQITFNPAICRRLGPDLCEFFRAHEYGHVNLRHLERGVPPRLAEHEADMWAAKHASPAAVAAARKFFSQGKGGSSVHGSSAERLRRINAARQNVAIYQPVSGTGRRSTVARPTKYSGGSQVIVDGRPLVRLSNTARKHVVYRIEATPKATGAYIPRGGFIHPRR